MFKKIIKGIIVVFIAFCFLLLSGHYLSTVVDKLRTITTLFLDVVFSFLILLKGNKEKRVAKETVIMLSVLLTSLVCTFIVNLEFEEIISYFNFLSLIYISFCVFKLISFNEFIVYYKRVLLAICVVSLFFYVANLFGASFVFFGYVTNVNGIPYANNIIHTFYTSEFTDYRNMACFWEPGLFSTYLIIGIIFESFSRKLNILAVLIYVICIITSFSAAGFVLLVLTLPLLFIKKGVSSSRKAAFIFAAVFIGVMIVAFKDLLIDGLYTVSPSVAKKIFDSDFNLSFQTSRLDCPKICLSIFAENPLFGKGLFGTNIEYASISNDVAMTSSSFYMLSVFGIGGVAYTIGWLVGIFKIGSISFIQKVLVASIFILILNKEPHFENLLLWIIFFFFLNYVYVNQRAKDEDLVYGEVEKCLKYQ